MRILLIALLAVVALPAAADAATVSRTGGTLRYEAGKGERISGSLIETGGGAFLARSDKRAHQRLVPGAGCKRSRPHELRCAGLGIARVQISLKRARTSSLMVQDVRVAVAAVGSAGTNTIQFRRTPDFTYDGGAKRDDVAVRTARAGTPRSASARAPTSSMVSRLPSARPIRPRRSPSRAAPAATL